MFSSSVALPFIDSKLRGYFRWSIAEKATVWVGYKGEGDENLQATSLSQHNTQDVTVICTHDNQKFECFLC